MSSLFDTPAADVRKSIEEDIRETIASQEEFRRRRREADPETSNIAARKVAPHLADLQRDVLALVKQHPGRTAMELARIYGGPDCRTIGRRLPELVEQGRLSRGDPRACEETGREATTWWPE